MTPANDNKTHFTDLRQANIARQKEWDSDSKISGTLGKLWRANELSGECGEASNVVKKLVREELGIRGSRATVEQLSEELADIVICADLLAQEYGIDLNEATRAKFNATSEKVGLLTRLVAA
ncbi:putative NTP pyrophosphohydrolase MazG-like protein [Rhizobium phage RHph_X2_25]|nr:putative NTP pyrophosphohydrolase MazG-like protein [Rhizobium phage RHph_X2_25]